MRPLHFIIIALAATLTGCACFAPQHASRIPRSNLLVACFTALFVLSWSAVAQDIIVPAPAGEPAVLAQKVIRDNFDDRWRGSTQAPESRMTEHEKRDLEYRLRCQPSEYKDSLGVTHLKYAHPDCGGRILN